MSAKVAWLLVATLMAFTGQAFAADTSPEDAATRVLASVGDQWITQADVELSLGRAGKPRADLPPIPEPVVMATVDIIARQRQALETLARAKKRVSDAQVDVWLLENSPPELELSAAQALAARAEAAQVSPESYRAFLAFRLSWQAYVQQTLTDKNIEKHFAKQKPRFDGTRFQVEHLVLPVPPGASPERTAAHERLSKLCEQIAAGDLDFAGAGREWMDAEGEKASAPLWITGSGPLIPAVIDRVLDAPVGQILEPFDSAQGVHLVRVLAREPGNRTFAEAKEDVRKHVLLFLLDYLAEQSKDALPLVWQGRSK